MFIIEIFKLFVYFITAIFMFVSMFSWWSLYISAEAGKYLYLILSIVTTLVVLGYYWSLHIISNFKNSRSYLEYVLRRGTMFDFYMIFFPIAITDISQYVLHYNCEILTLVMAVIILMIFSILSLFSIYTKLRVVQTDY